LKVKPPQKLKRRTVYFVKTAAARLDNDNIRAVVRETAAGGPERAARWQQALSA
jgi:hypothetical protein